MRLKYRIKEGLRFLSFAFYPKTSLIACTVFSAISIIILGFVMVITPHDSNMYNIAFALTTGAAGSFFVSFVLELAGNYRHNKLAWHELQEYYSVIMDYESRKQVMMQLTPAQRARKKAHEEFVVAGGIEDIYEDRKPKDVIQITWRLLPDIIPVFISTLDNKKDFLSDVEIDELRNIVSEYERIQQIIRLRVLMSPMTYDAFNHPDEEYLKSIYPADVIRNMPYWIRKQLAAKESRKACDVYADAILADSELLLKFMENYDISQHGLDSYEVDDEKLEETVSDDTDHDEIDYSEPEDEEAFRAQSEAVDIQMELKQRPFESWHLSQCCKHIAESMDILEKSIMRKPYYGMIIKYFADSAEQPCDDYMSSLSYESEKERLDKKLEKQK